jgi:hypothetical protein
VSSVLGYPLRFPQKKLCSVRLYLQLFVERMSYLRNLFLFVYSGV